MKIYLHEVDPLKSVCKKRFNDHRIFYRYNIYSEYYEYLKIISERLNDDYEQYLESLDDWWNRIEKIQNKKLLNLERIKSVRNTFTLQRAIQLDTQSYIVFMRILLDKLGILMELLIGHPNDNSHNTSFSKHKKYFSNPENRSYNKKYSDLLTRMYWYDQYFVLIRDKLVQHGRQWHSYFHRTDNGFAILLIGKYYGFLKGIDKTEFEKIVEKYAPSYHSTVMNVDELPIVDIAILMTKILKDSEKMESKDLQSLGHIIQKTGASIEIPPIAKKLRDFLSETRSILV